MTALQDNQLKVVIPARYGSRRLPGKPLLDLCGEPMIVHVVKRATSALSGADVWVATDDERIKVEVERHGYRALMTSTRHESGLDRTAEVARELNWSKQDIVINVQGDEPLIEPELIRRFAHFCSSRESFEVGSVMSPMESAAGIFDSNVVKVIINQCGEAISFSRAPLPFCRDAHPSDYPYKVYRRHIGLYAYSVSALLHLAETPPCDLEILEKLEQLRALWLGYRIAMLSWPDLVMGGVDVESDINRVREILEHGRSL